MIFDVGLIHQRQLLQALLNTALCDFLAHGFGLVSQVIAAHFDGLFLGNNICRNFIRLHVFHIGAGGDLHSNVTNQGFELIPTGDKVGFAVHFYEHTNAIPGVNVLTNNALGGYSTLFFRGRGDALLP